MSDIAAISAAKHLGKFKKNKFKRLEGLEKGTPHRDVAPIFGETKNTLFTWKKKEKSSNRMKTTLGLKE